ncbi:unnamed protein product [Amoebophrya sp. A25]|nr:unnamed protein product [Amoebophrya sp. A25]|eukprot:GSA25T00009016001.1
MKMSCIRRRPLSPARSSRTHISKPFLGSSSVLFLHIVFSLFFRKSTAVKLTSPLLGSPQIVQQRQEQFQHPTTRLCSLHENTSNVEPRQEQFQDETDFLRNMERTFLGKHNAVVDRITSMYPNPSSVKEESDQQERFPYNTFVEHDDGVVPVQRTSVFAGVAALRIPEFYTPPHSLAPRPNEAEEKTRFLLKNLLSSKSKKNLLLMSNSGEESNSRREQQGQEHRPTSSTRNECCPSHVKKKKNILPQLRQVEVRRNLRRASESFAGLNENHHKATKMVTVARSRLKDLVHSMCRPSLDDSKMRVPQMMQTAISFRRQEFRRLRHEAALTEKTLLEFRSELLDWEVLDPLGCTFGQASGLRAMCSHHRVPANVEKLIQQLLCKTSSEENEEEIEEQDEPEMQ